MRSPVETVSDISSFARELNLILKSGLSIDKKANQLEYKSSKAPEDARRALELLGIADLNRHTYIWTKLELEEEVCHTRGCGVCPGGAADQGDQFGEDVDNAVAKLNQLEELDSPESFEHLAADYTKGSEGFSVIIKASLARI